MTVLRLRHNVAAEVVLQEAMDEGDLDEILIIAYRKDRYAPMYTNTNISDGATTLWMLEHTKLRVLKVVDDDA